MNAEICGGGSEGSPSQVEKGQTHRVNNPVCQQDTTSSLYSSVAMFTVSRIQRFSDI